MISHHAPGARDAHSIALSPGPPLVVGRGGREAQPQFFDVGARGGRCSRRHGAFFVDSAGLVRYVDMKSRHGSLLLPAKGWPRRVPPRRPVVVWPGDAVAVGGALPREINLDRVFAKMHIFCVVSHLPKEEEARESAATTPVTDALACTVCQETMVAPRVIGCGHTFCDDCISRWFRDKDTCPTCRAQCEPGAVATGGAACVQLEALVRLMAGDEARRRMDERDTMMRVT